MPPYTKTTWKDRVVDQPRTYNVQNNPDGTITLFPAPGTVHEEGTKAVAAIMNKMEQGIADSLPKRVDRGTENYAGFGSYGRIFESEMDIGSITAPFEVWTYNCHYNSGWKTISGGVATALIMREGQVYVAKSQNTGAANTDITWTVNDAITRAGGEIGPYPAITNALLRMRVGSNAIEWGHTNLAGYQAVLGADNGNGAPVIALNAEIGTTGNTYRTRGLRGVVFRSDNNGGFQIRTLPDPNADNQVGVEIMRVNNAGEAYFANGHRAWDETRLRINNGVLEFLIGGEWRPVGNVQVGRPRTAKVNDIGSSWTTIVDASGVSGRLEQATFGGGTGGMAFIRVTIDGKSDELTGSYAGVVLEYIASRFGGEGSFSIQPTTEPIYFYNSLKIEAMATSGSGNATVAYRLKTGTP